MGISRPGKSDGKGGKGKSRKVSKKSEKELQNWAAGGGGAIPTATAPIQIEKPFVLRYPVDMNGLAKIINDLADLIAPCRLLTALEPNPAEERAIARLKGHILRHVDVLRAGVKLDYQHARLTIENAQKLYDSFKSEYDRFFAGWQERYDRFMKEVGELAPQLLEGANKTQLDFLKKEFEAVYGSARAKPDDVIRSYRSLRNFLIELSGKAHTIAKREQKKQEEIFKRKEVAEVILVAADKL